MNIDNKRALILLAILIVVLTTLTIIVGKIAATVHVEPKNVELENNISSKIDKIVEGDIEHLNEEVEKVNEIENN